jgi:ribokinase
LESAKIDSDDHWRYVQHLPDAVLLAEADVHAAAEALADADAVLVQLQQPPAATVAAARIGAHAGRLVVLDGALPPDPGHRDALLAAATVVRADAREAQDLFGVSTDDPDEIRRAATDLLTAGPSLIAIALTGSNLFVWRDGHLDVPIDDGDVTDTTGGGDAFVAALTTALLRGDDPRSAACHAVAASGATVGHVGGRPHLTPQIMQTHLDRVRHQLGSAA